MNEMAPNLGEMCIFLFQAGVNILAFKPIFIGEKFPEIWP